MINKATSITHQHLLSVLNTELHASEKKVIRILDMGCGNGHLIKYLMESLSVLKPKMVFEIYGFDVDNHGVQPEGYFVDTIALLSNAFPDIPWGERFEIFSDKESWPYQEDFFDFIISNQVFEHINDHSLVFSEIRRTLCENGCSVHLFPLVHYIYEAHLNLPLVHKVLNYNYLIGYIKLLSRFGLGKYNAHKAESSISLDEFAERHADYMCFFTNYLSYSEALSFGKKIHYVLRLNIQESFMWVNYEQY